MIWFETPEKDWEALEKKWNVINEIAKKVPIDDDFIYEEFDISQSIIDSLLKREQDDEGKFYISWGSQRVS